METPWKRDNDALFIVYLSDAEICAILRFRKIRVLCLQFVIKGNDI